MNHLFLKFLTSKFVLYFFSIPLKFFKHYNLMWKSEHKISECMQLLLNLFYHWYPSNSTNKLNNNFDELTVREISLPIFIAPWANNKNFRCTHPRLNCKIVLLWFPALENIGSRSWLAVIVVKILLVLFSFLGTWWIWPSVQIAPVLSLAFNVVVPTNCSLS